MDRCCRVSAGEHSVGGVSTLSRGDPLQVKHGVRCILQVGATRIYRSKQRDAGGEEFEYRTEPVENCRKTVTASGRLGARADTDLVLRRRARRVCAERCRKADLSYLQNAMHVQGSVWWSREAKGTRLQSPSF